MYSSVQLAIPAPPRIRQLHGIDAENSLLVVGVDAEEWPGPLVRLLAGAIAERESLVVIPSGATARSTTFPGCTQIAGSAEGEPIFQCLPPFEIAAWLDASIETGIVAIPSLYLKNAINTGPVQLSAKTFKLSSRSNVGHLLRPPMAVELVCSWDRAHASVEFIGRTESILEVFDLARTLQSHPGR